MTATAELDTDCDWVRLSPRSKLYRLPIAGRGTGHVEAITSYLMRLATAHLHLVGTIVTHVLGPSVIGSRSSRAAATTELVPRARTANGNDAAAKAWSDAIRSATLVEGVSAMTMLPWSTVLPTRGVLASSLRHCPSCLNEMAAAELVYEPLAWALSMSTVCLRHGTRLLDTCWSCNGTQHALTRSSRPGMCRRCDQWLGDGPAERILSQAPTDWERFSSGAVIDLIANTPAEDDSPDNALIGPVVRQAMLAARASQKAFARRIGVAESTLSEISNHAVAPSLETTLRVCAAGGWSAAAFLRGRLEQVCAPLVVLPTGGTRRPIDWVHVERELLAAIERTGEPEAAANVAKRLGIGIGFLRRNRPELIAALVAKRQTWIADTKAARLEDAIATVEAITRHIVSVGGTASRRQVELYLPAPLQLRERPLQEAWRRARAA